MTKTLMSYANSSLDNLIRGLSEQPEKFRRTYDAWCKIRRVQSAEERTHSFDEFRARVMELAENIKKDLALPENKSFGRWYFLASMNIQVQVHVFGGHENGKHYPMTGEAEVVLVDHYLHF